MLIENNFPHIANEFRNNIITYVDDNMEFRRKMIRNLHYLRDMDDDIINMIISKLEVMRYAKDQIIIKNGDISDRLMFLRKGRI